MRDILGRMLLVDDLTVVVESRQRDAGSPGGVKEGILEAWAEDEYEED